MVESLSQSITGAVGSGDRVPASCHREIPNALSERYREMLQTYVIMGGGTLTSEIESLSERLIAEGIIDKPASSKTTMRAVQGAFNTWMDQSGRSLTEISRVVAMSL